MNARQPITDSEAQASASPASAEQPSLAAAEPAPEPITRRPVKRRTEQALYRGARSFVDFLPWVEYLPEHQAMLLQDGVSVGAVLEVTPLGTSGRTGDALAEIRDTLEEALQDSFDEDDAAPWILQTYTYDEHDLDRPLQALRDYVRPHARGSDYTEAYLATMARHYRGVARPGGLFHDEVVTKTPWSGAVRRNLMVLYRKYARPRKRRAAEEAVTRELALMNLNDGVAKLGYALAPAGVGLRRLDGVEFHNWLLELFNPPNELFGGDHKAFLDSIRHHPEDGLPYGNRFAESLFYTHPRSDQDNACWWLGEAPVRCISIDGIRRRPAVGHVTGETRRGDATNTLLDLLPEGSVFVSTLVVVPQDSMEAHITAINESAIGDNSETAQVRLDCQSAREVMAARHKFYRAQYAVYVRGTDLTALNERTTEVRSRLLNYGFRAIAAKDDFTALDAFVRNLPMVYDPHLDAREGWRGAQITLVQHIANLSCFFGRTRGTGHPGMALFNRGGEPVFIDPLNQADRQKNAHMLVLGPPGAGKSATLVSLLSHVMAIHRPRLFVIEAGNSFGLMGQWFASLGLSVNQVSLKPGSGVTLSPFQDAHLLLARRNLDLEAEDDRDSDDGDDEQRDVLGEMETVALLMITGGEEREANEIRRSDRAMIRRAILQAAEDTAQRGTPTRTEDVRDAFNTLALSAESERDADKLRDMGKAIDLYCLGFNGEVFNQSGSAWPEADVTIIDLATFAREGYEANLAIAVISCLNMINNIAERDQFEEREIVVTIDEAHIITTNPLLAPYLVKVVKMWRKLGAWLWSATQNMEDYPAAAKKMLNIVEWWLCLVMPKEEIEALAQFRQVDAAQREMLLSVSKAPGKYTEGVLMAEGQEFVVRNVPPSLMLALAQTEKHEKARRNELMQEHGISELEAAIAVAAEIDRARGIADV
ncbi:MAG: conjugative transfer ATPase [Parahaliea sp.]